MQMPDCKKASHVACVSRTVRDEILAHDLIPVELLSVVPNGIDPACSPVEDEQANRQAKALLAGAGQDSLLMHVGRPIPRTSAPACGDRCSRPSTVSGHLSFAANLTACSKQWVN
jgi:hypothetical protein